MVKMREFSPAHDRGFASSVDIFNFNKKILVKDYKQHDQQNYISDILCQ